MSIDNLNMRWIVEGRENLEPGWQQVAGFVMKPNRQLMKGICGGIPARQWREVRLIDKIQACRTRYTEPVSLGMADRIMERLDRGAKDEFAVFEACAMISNTPRAWPLYDEATNKVQAVMVAAIRNGDLGPDISFNYGWMEANGAAHKTEIPRYMLAHYIRTLKDVDMPVALQEPSETKIKLMPTGTGGKNILSSILNMAGVQMTKGREGDSK